MNQHSASSRAKTWIVVEDLVGSGIIASMPQTDYIQVVTKKELASRPDLRIEKGAKVIIATETVLDEVLRHLEDETKREWISKLKHKIYCRRILASLFPDFF